MNPVPPISVLIFGLGNIGSHLVRRLAAMSRIVRILLVDSDRYSASNLTTQAIERADVGRFKVEAQAFWLRNQRPDLEIETFAEPLEAVPLGVYRSVDVVLSGLDSRRARLELNERVFQTGVPLWLDSGVSPDDGGLVRVSAFRPSIGASTPCLECDWTPGDYAAIEQRFPCQAATGSFPTGAPSELGDRAAGLQIETLHRLLSGEADRFDQETVASPGGTRLTTRLRRNPDCRFPHREAIAPDFCQGIDLETRSLGWFLERIAPFPECGFRIEGAGTWIRRVACPGCGFDRKTLILEHRGPGDLRSCPNCAKALLPVGFESQPILWRDELGNETLSRTLAEIGLRRREEVTFFRSRVRPEALIRLALS